MRKLIIILVMAIAVLPFTSCDSSGITNDNIITEAQLTAKEKTLLSVGSNYYFAFDFKVNDKFKWAEVWVERYEHGKKVPGSGSISTGLSAGEGGMIIAAVRESGKQASEWTLAISSGGSLSKAESNLEYTAYDNAQFASVRSTNRSRISIGEKEIVLANACYEISQEEETILTSLSNEFYNNPEEHMEEIAEYDLVYLLKCKFNTESQP